MCMVAYFKLTVVHPIGGGEAPPVWWARLRVRDRRDERQRPAHLFRLAAWQCKGQARTPTTATSWLENVNCGLLAHYWRMIVTNFAYMIYRSG